MKGTRPGDVSADRHRRRLGKADDELVGWFRSNVGVRAQGYEPGHAFDSHELHASRLRSMRWLMGGTGAREWFDRVAETMALLPADTRRTIELIYTPRSAPTWLADVLATPWGGGSFVALAASLPEAAEKANGAHVPTWLETLGRGSHLKMFRTLSLECEQIRIPALAVYELLRGQRVKQEQVADRARKVQLEERNAALFEAEVGKKRRRSAERFDARVRRVA